MAITSRRSPGDQKALKSPARDLLFEIIDRNGLKRLVRYVDELDGWEDMTPYPGDIA